MDRIGYIGGSDIGDLLSLAPYGCQLRLWREKRGEAPDRPETAPMKRGTRLEEVGAEEFARRTGWEVRRYKEVRKSFAVAHIDRHIVAAEGRTDPNGRPLNGPGVLEIKCPGDFAFRRIKYDGLSQAYVAQLQWYLGLTGWQWGAWAVFNANGWELEWWPVHRDEEMIAMLGERASEFWQTIRTGPEPQRFDIADKRCAHCHVRSSCHGLDAIGDMPEWDGEIEQDPGLDPLVTEYLQAAEIASEADALKKQIAERLKAEMGDRQCVDAPSGRIYHALVKRKAYQVAATTYKQLRVFAK